MRNNFAKEILRLAAFDQRIVLLSGDIGNRLFDDFKKKFKKRFFNCGIAEANMTSMAAGMAMCGLKPITYTIAPFNTTRCLEQIRNDIAYHNLPVIIIGLGAGLSYSSLGGSHISCEDISFLRSIPNMSVVCPCDSFELRALLKEALKTKGPVYFRIGKKGEANIYSSVPKNLKIGKGNFLKKGNDICIIATGNIMPVALDVLKKLKDLSISLISMHSVKPIDKNLLKEVFTASYKAVVSIEEHSLIGGLSSSISEFLIDEKLDHSNFLRFGTSDIFPFPLGDQNYMRNIFGLSSENIIKKIKTFLGKKCIQKLQS